MDVADRGQDAGVVPERKARRQFTVGRT